MSYTYKKKIRRKPRQERQKRHAHTKKKGGTKYRRAGKGTYGIVIAPGLPNKNNDGTTRNFPNNVTKIFTNAYELHKALAASNTITRNVPSLAIRTDAYKHQYKFKNLPEEIKKPVANFFREAEVPLTNETPLSMFRTPNLGISFSDIDNSTEYREIRKIPLEAICKQLHKCLRVVQSIHDAGYIHGDIRETNVLCNSTTGAMTIIDFDWLYPFDKFYEEYPTFFYPHPPECLFIWGRDNLYEYPFPNDEVSIFNDPKNNIAVYKYVDTPYDIYDADLAGKAITEFKKSYRPSYSSNRDYGITEWSDDLFDIAKHFIDSYGLGHSFQVLLEKAWYYDLTQYGELRVPPMNTLSKAFEGYDIANFLRVRQFLFEELIPGLTDSDYKKRWTVDKALEEFEEVLGSVGIRVEEDVSKELEKMKKLALTEDIVPQLLPLLPPSPNSLPASPKPPSSSPKRAVEALDKIEDKAENKKEGGKRHRRRTHKKSSKVRRD